MCQECKMNSWFIRLIKGLVSVVTIIPLILIYTAVESYSNDKFMWEIIRGSR
jgi:hypothetical protein